MTRHRRRGFKLRSVYNWHRYLGLSAALLVLVLAITGVMLNHTSEFKLDKAYVTSDWILNWYGIQAPQDIRVYADSDALLSQWGQRLFRDRQPLATSPYQLRGGISTSGYRVIATTEELWLYTLEGELVEKITSAHGLPTPIQQLGISPNGNIVVQTIQGTFEADADLLNWSFYSSARIQWSAAAQLPEKIYRDLLAEYRGQDLPWERVVLDIHSGRFFGHYGVFIMDAAAIVLMLLAASGCWLWGVRLYKQRQHQKSRH